MRLAVRGAVQPLGLNSVEPAYVLSRFTTQHPISEAQLSNTLGRPLFAKIPRDDKAIERVQLRGQDLFQAAPNSSLARAVEELAVRLSSPSSHGPSEQPSGIKLLSRLRDALGTSRSREASAKA